MLELNLRKPAGLNRGGFSLERICVCLWKLPKESTNLKPSHSSLRVLTQLQALLHHIGAGTRFISLNTWLLLDSMLRITSMGDSHLGPQTPAWSCFLSLFVPHSTPSLEECFFCPSWKPESMSGGHYSILYMGRESLCSAVLTEV